MTDAERSFEMGLWPTVGTAAGLVLLVALGGWQTSRYMAKKKREQTRERRIQKPPVEIDSLEDLDEDSNYRRVELHGKLDTSTRISIKHRSYNGDPGSWLVQPFEFDDSDDVLLVNRGWIPFQKAKDDLDRYAQPPDDQPLVGLLYRLPNVVADEENRRKLQRGELDIRGARSDWDTFDVAAIHDALAASTPEGPYTVILAPKHTGDRYPIASYEHVTKPYLTATRHLGYAVFWFAVALALVGIYVAAGYGVLRSRTRGRARIPNHDGE